MIAMIKRVGDRINPTLLVQKLDSDTMIMNKTDRNTNSLMDMPVSLLLLSMTYTARTGPRTFSGEESKPD